MLPNPLGLQVGPPPDAPNAHLRWEVPAYLSFFAIDRAQLVLYLFEAVAAFCSCARLRWHIGRKFGMVAPPAKPAAGQCDQ